MIHVINIEYALKYTLLSSPSRDSLPQGDHGRRRAGRDGRVSVPEDARAEGLRLQATHPALHFSPVPDPYRVPPIIYASLVKVAVMEDSSMEEGCT
jgi:hypothetical protein